MKVNTNELLKVVDQFKFIYISNNYNKQSNFIFFNKAKDVIYCGNSDMLYEHKMSEVMDLDCITDNEVAIRGKELLIFLKKIKAETIDIKQVDNVIMIKNGRNSVNKFLIDNIRCRLLKADPSMQYEKLPDITREIFNKHIVFNRMYKQTKKILFRKQNCMVSTDNNNIVYCGSVYNVQEMTVDWNVLKHCLQYGMSHVANNGVIKFTDRSFKLSVRDTPNDAFEYEKYFEGVDEYQEMGYCIYMNKEENIDHLDTFLLQYKDLDKKVVVKIKDSTKLIVIVKGDVRATGETRQTIPIEKYRAGESMSFKIGLKEFKDLYNNFDYFSVTNGMIYASNLDDGVERLFLIENLEDTKGE